MQLTAQGDRKKKLGWHIVFGMSVSAAWLLLLVLYLTQQMSWQQFLQSPLDKLGSFLGGAFSPLAFLWLVIGFFIQQGEIHENARNIEIQAQHTNLDNFLKMAEIVYRHMGVITGYLLISCREEMESVASEPLNLEDKWSRSSTGDAGVFARMLVSYQIDDDGRERDMAQIFFSTPVRRRHSENYRNVFEGLLENARLCDAAGGLHDALVDGTEWGVLYKTLVGSELQQRIKGEKTKV